MTTTSLLYAAAAFACVVSYAAHAFGGGALMARPFYRKAAAHNVSTHAFRYCWHFVSVALVAMAAGFASLAVDPRQWFLGAFLTLTAAVGSGLSVLVAGMEKSPPLKSPPTTLFAIIAALGCAALITD
jgi:hypothetical protein